MSVSGFGNRVWAALVACLLIAGAGFAQSDKAKPPADDKTTAQSQSQDKQQEDPLKRPLTDKYVAV